MELGDADEIGREVSGEVEMLEPVLLCALYILAEVVHEMPDDVVPEVVISEESDDELFDVFESEELVLCEELYEDIL